MVLVIESERVTAEKRSPGTERKGLRTQGAKVSSYHLMVAFVRIVLPFSTVLHGDQILRSLFIKNF